MKIKKAEKELSQCTFEPNIGHQLKREKRYGTGIRDLFSKKRFDDFLEKQRTYEVKK